MADAADLRVIDNPAEHRFEAWRGSELAGFVTYRLEGNKVVFIHTEVNDAFEGMGIGGRLAAGALDQVRDRGRAVVPLCPFIRSYIERHNEYADLVAATGSGPGTG